MKAPTAQGSAPGISVPGSVAAAEPPHRSLIAVRPASASSSAGEQDSEQDDRGRQHEHHEPEGDHAAFRKFIVKAYQGPRVSTKAKPAPSASRRTRFLDW